MLELNMDFEAKHIGSRIKIIQKELHIHPKEMAKKINISDKTLYRYIRGTITIPVDNCFSIIREYHVNPMFLFFGDDSQGMFLKYDINYKEALLDGKKLIEASLDYTSEDERRKYALQITEILRCLLQ